MNIQTGVELITAERQRQKDVEGWTPEHDDQHQWGQLAKAAACYAVHHTDAEVVEGGEPAWPWADEWDKRDNNDITRQLVKAGALIAAEIDRIQRQDARATS
jgi:hypothetical protein